MSGVNVFSIAKSKHSSNDDTKNSETNHLQFVGDDRIYRLYVESNAGTPAKNGKNAFRTGFPKIDVVAVLRNFTERSGKRQDLYSIKIPQP